jgi:branched-chain amino acid transport system permease protein
VSIKVGSTEASAPAAILSEHPAAALDSNGRAVGLYLVGMAAALVPMLLALGSPYWLNIVTETYLMAGLASAWNIIGGFGGQFSLAHGVFFGAGAYATAILYTAAGVPPVLGLLPGALLATVVALLISWPTFRLRGPFFAIATMAFNEVAFVLVNYADAWTGGPRGILIPFRAGLANLIFAERWKYAALMFAFLLLVTAVALRLRRSRLGYYLIAVREDEEAARASGINVLAVKLEGMAVSAALTAIGGGLFATYLRFVDPSTVFTLSDVGVKFALLALIGGIGTLAGPALGAALVVPTENYLRSALGGIWPGGNLVVLGAAMVLAALFLKGGVVGAFAALYRRAQGRP